MLVLCIGLVLQSGSSSSSSSSTCGGSEGYLEGAGEGGGVSGGVVGSGRVEGVSGRVGSQCQSESAKSISKCD